MVQLSDILDVALLREHVKNGLVYERFHNELPLVVYNYTPACAWDRAWDDVTKKCRGLIVNRDTLEVVARPFEKFWNWDESSSPFPPAGPCLRMPKMDGSLGVLYNHLTISENWAEMKLGISTRGSFHSEQAEWATKFLSRSDGFLSGGFVPLLDKTYLFEIIYPENRIVVDYGDWEGLTLIDVIDTDTGLADTAEFDECQWPDKVVRTPMTGFDSGQAQEIPKGDEGFVYLWPVRNFRTKMKSATYVILHRLISNLSEKSIWEQLVAGKTLDDIKKDLPEEFHGFVDEKGGAILRQTTEVLKGISVAMYNALNEFNVNTLLDIPRKDLALAIKDSPYRKYIFLSLDNKPMYPVILRDVKPVTSRELIDE